ncbi:hypothetical protein [Xylanibacter brevis]|uniref:hypothetical protein n=1 Tax=Xylanibacter brevis TaxID=83231 RepID=UPI0012DD9E5E|nr:hypothetical protein [Xylanibacter brevis]
MEQGGNNEGIAGTSGESGIGTVVSGGNRGTGEVNETPNGGTNQPNGTTANENGGSRTEGGDQPLGATAQPVGQTSQGNQTYTGSTNGKGKFKGTTGSTFGKAGGTRQSGQPGNLFGEDNGNGTNDTPGIEQGGTVASVPDGGIVVTKTDGKPKKPLADITQEKSPYKPASIGGKFAIGSVIPSGIADSIANAFKRLKEKFFPKKDSTLDFVREELGYKTKEEMFSAFESGKTSGLASEQVDAVALAFGQN